MWRCADFGKSDRLVSFLKIGTPTRNRGSPGNRQCVAMRRFWQKRPVGEFSENRDADAKSRFSRKPAMCGDAPILAEVACR